MIPEVLSRTRSLGPQHSQQVQILSSMPIPWNISLAFQHCRWLGLTAIFQKASECQPACIIIDGADHLFARRSANQSEEAKSIGCCLREAMSRVTEDDDKRVMLIATTTAPEDFDYAFIRRFPCCIYVKLPDRGAIMAMFEQHLAGAAPHFASGSHFHSCNGLNAAIATATATATSTWCHLVMLFDAFKGYQSRNT